MELALDHPKIARWLDRYPPDPTTSGDYREDSGTWLVKAWSGAAGQVVQAVVEDSTGTVTEAWTGPQVAWKMARGREGAFGGKTLLKPYVWLAFCLVFLLGLADLRRPLSTRNLDLLALLGFTVSLAFFDRGEIFRSVPLVYPVLAYLLARGLWVGVGRRSGVLTSVWPTWVLAASAVFLLGFRIGLNLEAPRGVIDVGLAGVVGADRILDGEAPYGNMPQRGTLEPCGPKDAEGQVRERIQTNGRCESAIERGDTYGPVSYLAYVPAVTVFGWSGKWDSLPAAHATSIAFDLLAVLALLLVGLRYGGRRLAVLLAFAWTAYPFTAYTLDANTNDTIMPAFLLLGFWFVTSDWARGASVALAGWTKFGALLAAPLWATYPTYELRRVLRFAAAFVVATVLAFAVLLLEPSSVGGAPHVLGPDDRVPVGTRLTVLDLGVGPVPRAGNPGPRLPAACRCDARGRTRSDAGIRPAKEGADRARRSHRGRPRRLRAHADPLVLPLSPVGRSVRVPVAAPPGVRASGDPDADGFDRRGLTGLGVALDERALDTHSALSGLESDR